MNAFDGEADAKRPPPVDMIELARGDNQEGPQPLAAADRGMAHRVIEPVPRVLRHREQAVQQPVDPGADFRERGFQLVQRLPHRRVTRRSEEHTSELQSLMRTTYAVFCLPKYKYQQHLINKNAKHNIN